MLKIWHVKDDIVKLSTAIEQFANVVIGEKGSELDPH